MIQERFIHAAQEGELAELENILKENDLDFALEKEGLRGFYLAVHQGHMDFAIRLLEVLDSQSATRGYGNFKSYLLHTLPANSSESINRVDTVRVGKLVRDALLTNQECGLLPLVQGFSYELLEQMIGISHEIKFKAKLAPARLPLLKEIYLPEKDYQDFLKNHTKILKNRITILGKSLSVFDFVVMVAKEPMFFYHHTVLQLLNEDRNRRANVFSQCYQLIAPSYSNHRNKSETAFLDPLPVLEEGKKRCFCPIL